MHASQSWRLMLTAARKVVRLGETMSEGESTKILLTTPHLRENILHYLRMYTLFQIITSLGM